MITITLAIPEEMKKKMETFPEINWSEIARQAIIQRLAVLEKMNELLKNSKFTEADALRIGREINKGMTKRIHGNKKDRTSG